MAHLTPLGTVAIYEGDVSGKDDKICSINYFVKNYSIENDSINFKELLDSEEIE
ncbi:MAG: hypothetical protein HFJ34_06025 [Clostridia bacterium]|nr:hypothetical protein [Clostridia bacterium]